MMETPPTLSCSRCGGTLRNAFVGKICPRCLVSGVASTQHAGPDFSDVREAALPVPPLEGAEAWRVGMRLGDYELLDVLGSGGMAVVYLARQVSLDRLVALKTISATLATDVASQERFRREARAVAQLDHPGIVSIHDAGTLCGALFYTMDYVDGPDLGRVLRERSLPPPQAARLVQRVAEAVGYAHARGIIHRDLKPANVLVDDTGEPRVADFGLALEARGMGTGPTLTGDLLGTPPYMAPEILSSGAKRATPPSDVYALGAMLFQMLTGRTPFIGGSPSEILHLALTTQPPAPRLLNPAIPRDLETICLKCLEKSPSDRYRDAGAFGEDLARHLRGEPVHARPASAPMRVLRWGRRRPALATFIVALALGAGGATWAAVAINAGRQRAVLAEASAREGLWRANLAHAQAARRTTQANARQEALAALADAARFRPSLALRNESIAALCLDEASVGRSWPLNVDTHAPVFFDPALASYVAETAPGELVRWACADDREMGRFTVPNVHVIGMPVFSPDESYLAARYSDDAIRVWDVAGGRIAFVLPGRPLLLPAQVALYVNDFVFRPDGRQLAVGAPTGGFTLHAVPGGEEQGRGQAELPPTILRFSPDGSRLAFVGKQLAEVRLFDAQKLVETHRVALPSVPVCATWNPDGTRLAVGTRASRIHFIDASSGNIVDNIAAFGSGAVAQIVFHPREPMLVCNGADETISFWNAASGQLLMKLNGVNNVPVLTFNADGTRLGGYDIYGQPRASLIDIQTSPIFKSAASATPIHAALCSGALATSADGRWLACSEFGSVQLRDARTGQILQTLPSTSKNPRDMLSAQFTPDDRALIVNSMDDGLRRVEIAVDASGAVTFGSVQVLDPESGYDIEGVARDGRVVMCSEDKAMAKVVDPAKPAATIIRWPVAKITSAAFGPDDRQVLTEAGESVPGEAAVKVWDLSAAAPRCVASFGDDPGGRVQCSHDWVVVTGEQKTELWRWGAWTRGPKLPAELQGETNRAHLSPDGKWLAIAKDNVTHLIATANGEVLAACEAPVSQAGICVNEDFNADGTRLSLLWQYGSVHLWDLAAMHRELAKIGLDWAVQK